MSDTTYPEVQTEYHAGLCRSLGLHLNTQQLCDEHIGFMIKNSLWCCA